MTPLLWGAVALGAVVGAPLALVPLRERLEPQELVPDGRFLTAGGYRLHYRDDGPSTGPVVVLIHGFAAWSFSWRQQITALNAVGFRTISIDQIGYGASERPAALVYATDQHALYHVAVLETLGIQRCQIVGHSFGGRIALQMALLAPERVESLALICPEAIATERPPIAAVAALPVLGQALAFYSLSPQLVRTGLAMLSGSDTWLTPAVVAGYAAPLSVRGSALAQVWQARSPKDGILPVPQNLSAIRQRTVLLWGERDPVFPLQEGQKVEASLPNAGLIVYPGVGHLPHEEACDSVTHALRTFLTNS
jgi:pimeloyl-ACP methyl ester carboxylesterase